VIVDSREFKLKLPRILSLLSILLFLVLLALVWIPELQHFYVRNETISRNLIEEGRTQPADEVLEEIRSHRTASRTWKDNDQIISSAEKLLKGRAELPTFEPIDIHLPFDPSDLDRGASVWQLQFAGLAVPEVLLDAYKLTGREEFYEMARDVILAWAKYERKTWLDRGFLWNDHAVADRARTIAEFWRVYRRRPDYRPEVAAEIWRFAARTAAFLAKPDLFNFATNHGVMQNIALLHLCIAFPTLPRVAGYEKTALSRLQDEMAFYIGPDGVVLEHSAEYDEYGLFLLGIAMRDATLLHLDVPREWSRKYEAAKNFYAEMLRPDGSLPTFGDTTIGQKTKSIPITELDESGHAGPLASRAEKGAVSPIGFYPVGGYAVLWDGVDGKNDAVDSSQTVLAWSYFPGHGHKHADEPSVLLWAKGHEWWTSVGYWPYDDPDRVHTECWEGSNAPHLAGEKCGEQRMANLLFYGSAPPLFAAEIERRGPNTLVIRRLMMHIASSTWIVVDQSSGVSGSTLQTIWTTAPEIRIQPTSAGGAYDLTAKGIAGKLHAYFWGAPSMSLRSFRGSRDPFAGWTTVMDVPQAADAIVTEQPSENAWAITVWVWDQEANQLRPSEELAPIVRWTSARDWNIALELKTGTEVISRKEELISVAQTLPAKPSAIVKTLELERPSPEIASQIAAIHEYYKLAADRYPRFKELFFYRKKASLLALAILFIQELFFIFYRRWGGTYVVVLRSIALGGWVALILWVPSSYLAPF
jgi:hypothetical protein